MARIADDVIERIKAEVSLLRLAESQGHQLTKQGKGFALRCPFHADKTPSCVISPQSNLFHCFGCGAAGSVIDWVMKTRGLAFRPAVEWLANDTGQVFSLAADAAEPPRKSTVPNLPLPVSVAGDEQQLLQEVIEFYHQTLLQSPEALAYLHKRGLDDAELISHFKLGYANRTLGLRLPQKNRKTGAELRARLQQIGIYRESGHEHFNGSLVIPCMDADGVIGEVYGRKLLDNLREGTPKHCYLPGPHVGVFNLAALASAREVILCESLIDALTFWRAGFRQVTASFGVNGFTAELLQALVSLGVERVLIAYDRDEAGDRAAQEVAQQLNQHGIEAFRVLFPQGMDANQYACQMQPAQKALAALIRQAEWMGNGSGPAPVISTAADDFSLAAKVAAVTAPPEPDAAMPDNPIDAQATPMPALPAPGAALEARDDGLYIQFGERLYRVRGLDKNASADQLKIQLLAQNAEHYHMDKLDLYSSKQRQVFINQASVELGVSGEVIKKDLGKLLLALEQEQLRQQRPVESSPVDSLDGEARAAALALLRDPALPARILADFTTAGVVGEETNKLVGYLAGVSRKLERPLAVVIQSSSAAGKSSLMDAVLAFMPEDERVQYSAMTGQSLFYMGETRLKHKILAISEEEGAHTASYALKLLQSEGEVRMASTGKDDNSGQLVTRDYCVEGPVMLFLTTTAIDIDEELMNRCLVLTVNESREQTEAIHQLQRVKRTLQGLETKLEKQRILQLHRNAQRLLRPLIVINPFADQLTFLADKTRTRRDHEKYLTLIDSIALLHQYQRPVKTLHHHGQPVEYIEATREDIALANRLAHEVLGKTLDELPPQTRQLLTLIRQWVTREGSAQGIAPRDFRFSRRQVRRLCGWSETQVRVHVQRLVNMEYLLTHRGGRGQSFEYELLYGGEGEDGASFLMGLMAVEQLAAQPAQVAESMPMTATSRGQLAHFAGPTRGHNGVIAAPANRVEASHAGALHEWPASAPKSTYQAL